MSNIDRIKDKLAKLLRLGENDAASEGEIQNALNLATAMMAKHNLTRDDIDLSAEDPIARVAFGRHFAFSRGASLATWECVLCHFILDFIGTIKWHVSPKMPVRRNGIAETDRDGNVRKACGVAFYGCDEDAACAVALFEELRDAISTMAIIRWGGWARGDGAAYAEGFATGIQSANSTAKRALMDTSDSQTTGLILISEKNQLAIREKATEWLAESCGIKKLTKGKSRSFSRSGSGEARAEGRRDGSNYGVSRPGRNARLS